MESFGVAVTDSQAVHRRTLAFILLYKHVLNAICASRSENSLPIDAAVADFGEVLRGFVLLL
jgi:hypothetical protein